MSPNRVSGLHLGNVHQTLFQSQMRMRCPTEVLAVLLIRSRKPAIICAEGPFLRIHHVGLGGGWSKERAQQEICHGRAHVGIQEQAALPWPGRGQRRPALKSAKDRGVRVAGERGLIGVLADAEVVCIVLLRVAGENGFVDLDISWICPPAQASRVDMRSQAVEGFPWRTDADGIGVGQGLRGSRLGSVSPEAI
jgi:hypothetical protein